MNRIALVAGVGVALLPALAAAICGRPLLAVVELHRAMEVPRNALVRIRLQPGWRTRILCSPADGEGACQETEPGFVLRSAPARDGRVEDVATTLSGSRGGPVEIVELAPVSALEAGRAYEVWAVDRKGHERERIIGAFGAGDRLDETPPAWSGAVSAQRVAQNPGSIEECGLPQAIVKLAGASDDQTRYADLRIALWVAKKRAGLDFGKPPDTYAMMPDPRLSGSHEPELYIGNSEADLSDFQLPATGPVALGMRVVNLAGNASAPSVLELR